MGFIFFNIQIMNDEIDDIYEEDSSFLEEDKVNKQYYIGIASKDLLLLSTISPKTFYKYDYQLVQQYLNDYSIQESEPRNIEIFQLEIQNNTYHVVLKTRWIRLIQRRWKKIVQNRLHYRKRLDSIFYFQTHGKYKKIPSFSIHGLINF